jgi:hypothetical protein
MDPMLYESPYFIGPDGAVAAKTYALFHEALKQSIDQAKKQRQQMIKATGKPAEGKPSKGRKRA